MQPLKDQPLLGLFNGAGKSTLVKAILGLIQSSGEILIDGEPTMYKKNRLCRTKSHDDFVSITIRECVL